MAKLSEIAFSNVLQKEFDISGHKVVFRTLNTEDNLKLNYSGSTDTTDNIDIKSTIQTTINILSLALVSVDGVVNEDLEDTKVFLGKLSPDDFSKFFQAFQSLTPTLDEIEKN